MVTVRAPHPCVYGRTVKGTAVWSYLFESYLYGIVWAPAC